MYIMNGKATFAKIMIDSIEQSARESIQTIVDCEVFRGSKISIMPDCHAGTGCVIGYTQTFEEGTSKIIPNLIGVDIGCGVSASNIGPVDIDLPALDDYIHANIPHGMKHRTETHPLYMLLNTMCKSMDDYIHRYFPGKHESISKQLGTLGGGNHFIEVGVDETNGDKWIFVHSGSRNFGYKIAELFQKEAETICDQFMVNVPKDLHFLAPCVPQYKEYITGMHYAQTFAIYNRSAILYDLYKHFGLIKSCDTQHGVTYTNGTSPSLNRIESVHNYIDFDMGIIRKGAISANLNEQCVIPFNMRDGVAICRGKGNKDYNYSAPHGAGRIMSRTKAIQEFKPEEVMRDMNEHNVYTSTAGSAVDEAPGTYKDMNTILSCIEPTVEVIKLIKPIYNFKSSDSKDKKQKGVKNE